MTIDLDDNPSIWLEEMPIVFPWDRDYDCFNIDDRVYVCLRRPAQSLEELEDPVWYSGVVVKGYRHHDGCVSYKLDDIGPREKEFWGCGTQVPSVLRAEDYEYFRKHPEFWRWWKRAVQQVTYNGNFIPLVDPS